MGAIQILQMVVLIMVVQEALRFLEEVPQQGVGVLLTDITAALEEVALVEFNILLAAKAAKAVLAAAAVVVVEGWIVYGPFGPTV